MEVKCVFVGYSITQKGYMCWSPIEKRLFVSMDVTFREFEPYYSSETTSPFGESLDTGGMRREGESSSDGERRMVSMDGIPCPPAIVESENEDLARVEPEKENSARVEPQWENSSRVEPQREDSEGEPKIERNGAEDGRTQAQEETRYREVYVRRNKQSEGAVPTVPPVPSPLSLPNPTPETLTPSTSDS